MAYKAQVLRLKNEDEWKEQRTLGIGSSEAGTILGQNPYCDLYEWWLKKTGREDEKETSEEAMRGHFLEDGVVQYFQYRTDAEIIKSSAPNIIYFDPEHPWRRVTPDRFGWAEGKPHAHNLNSCKFILECKTYRGYITNGNYPKYWRTQVMYQLGVCGCPYGYIAWIDSDLRIDFERIEFDQKEYDSICEAVDAVWDCCIVNGIEPDPTTAKGIVKKFPKEKEGKSVTFTNELSEKVARLAEIDSTTRELTAEKESITDAIKVAMADAEVAVDHDGNKLCTFKANSVFDEDRLRDIDPDTYNEFMVAQPAKFDTTAYKKRVGDKAYKECCTSTGARVLRISKPKKTA